MTKKLDEYVEHYRGGSGGAEVASIDEDSRLGRNMNQALSMRGDQNRADGGRTHGTPLPPSTLAARASKSVSPSVLLRISDGTFHMHRSFSDFSQAVTSAEAYAGAGFTVSMISATGRFLMGFESLSHRVAV